MFQCSAIIVFILSVAALIPYVILETCFHQQCVGCSTKQAKSHGGPVKCRLNNWVSALWIVKPLNQTHPSSYLKKPVKIPIEYSCLKMIAKRDDTTSGKAVDVLRGCVPLETADSVCADLVEIETETGYSDVNCYICNGNNCNSATQATLPLHATITTLLLYFILR